MMVSGASLTNTCLKQSQSTCFSYQGLGCCTGKGFRPCSTVLSIKSNAVNVVCICVHDIYGIYVHSHTYLCTTCTLKVPNVYSCISKFTPGNPPDLWDNGGDVVSFDQMNWMMWCTIGWLVWREWPVLPPWPPASKSVEFRLPSSMGGVLFCMTSCQGITSGIYCFFGGQRAATNGKRGTVEPVGTRPCVWCFTTSIVRSSKIWQEAGD